MNAPLPATDPREEETDVQLGAPMPIGPHARLAHSVASQLVALKLPSAARCLLVAISAWVLRAPRSQTAVIERVHAGRFELRREHVPRNAREFLVYRPDREGD